MTANEVTIEMLAQVEREVGFNRSHWQYADAREVIAAAMRLAKASAPAPAPVKAPVSKPTVTAPAEPELSDEAAHAKFYELLCDESDELSPSLDEKADQIVRRRHPKLAAAHDRHEEKLAAESEARRLSYRGRFAHR